jgi:hypothetical protein
MKDIKDYTHLYIGCEVMIESNGEEGFKAILKGVCASESEPGKTIVIIDNSYDEGYAFHEFYIEEAKLILRPLTDCSIEEAAILDSFKDTDQPGKVIPNNCKKVLGIRTNTAEAIRFLVSKGFDVFDLIDAGVALDKTKV